MYLLRTLGSTHLTDGQGREVDRLLQQTKRLALLAYLASPRPGSWHRRDVVVGLFWPELDATRARTTLRNALHVLRKQLGEGVILTRGDDEVSIDPTAFATDAALMEQDIADGRFAGALDRYEGEFLRGLFIRDAEYFERWLDDERRRLAAIARRAGIALAEERERVGDPAAAIVALERLTELDPHDESLARLLIGVLDRAGDRARALGAYDRFRQRLSEDFGAEPCAETIAQAEAIRGARTHVARPPAAAGETSHTPERDPAVGVTSSAIAHTAAPSVSDGPPASPPRQSRRARWLSTAVVVTGLVALAVTTSTLRSHDASVPKRLIILPVENAAEDSLAYIAFGIGDEVARQLRGVGGMETVISAATLKRPVRSAEAVALVGQAYGIDVAVRSRLTRRGDSLALTAEIVDVTTNRARSLGTFAFATQDIADAAREMAASIAGALFRVSVPAMPRATPDQLNSESYRLTLAGWDALINRGRRDLAKRLFLSAVEIDPTNARAWSGLSSSWISDAVVWRVPFADAAERGEAAGERALALDSLDGTPWANLGLLRALRSRRLADGEPLIAKAIAVDPSNPELYLIRSWLYRHAWQWDRARDAARMGRRIDPLSPAYIEIEGRIELCTDRPHEALRLFRLSLGLDPTSDTGRQGAARALARLGRWDEAVEQLRLIGPDSASSLPIARAAPDVERGSGGEAGYWALMENSARAELLRLRAQSKEGWVNPVQLAVTHIMAGEAELGMDLLEREAQSGDPGLYRLPCQVQLDRVRDTPRFQRVMASLPKWQP